MILSACHARFRSCLMARQLLAAAGLRIMLGVLPLVEY